jgi:prophage antirepressor-like protein
MNELTVFNFEKKDIRVVDVDGKPWFVLEAMGTSTPTNVALESIKQGLGVGITLLYPSLIA